MNLLEYFNIENLILPRSIDGSTILFDRIDSACLDYLSYGDFESAWQSQSARDKLDSVYETNTDFQYSLTKNFPSLNEFVNEHSKRWDALKYSNKSWCIKIMTYHYVNSQVLHDVFTDADTIVIIKRKDLVSQAISIIKAEHMTSNVWHTTDKISDIQLHIEDFPYEKIVPIIESIIADYSIYETMTYDHTDKTKVLYYEDANMTNSKYQKMTVDVQFNIDECYKLAKESGYDYTIYNV